MNLVLVNGHRSSTYHEVAEIGLNIASCRRVEDESLPDEQEETSHSLFAKFHLHLYTDEV
jgi:hypothetical protein